MGKSCGAAVQSIQRYFRRSAERVDPLAWTDLPSWHSATAFRLLYVFVVIEHHSRRLIHCNITAHPSAAWTLQQLREVIGLEDRYEYLLHDRDSIFAHHLDESIERLGVKVLRSPPHSPKANAVC